MASSFSELYNLRKFCRGSIWDWVETSIKDWMMDYLINSNRGRQSEKSCTTIWLRLWVYRCSMIASMGTKRCHHKWGAWVQLAPEWRTCAPKATPLGCCTTTTIQVWTCCPQAPYRIGRTVQDWCWLGWRRFPPSWSKNHMFMMVYDIDQKWLRLWVGLLRRDVDDLRYVAHDTLDEHLVDPDILIKRRLSQQADSLHCIGQEITKSSRLLQRASTNMNLNLHTWQHWPTMWVFVHSSQHQVHPRSCPWWSPNIAPSKRTTGSTYVEHSWSRSLAVEGSTTTYPGSWDQLSIGWIPTYPPPMSPICSTLHRCMQPS